MRLIDADALKDDLMEGTAPGKGFGEFVATVLCGVIDEQPTIESGPQWIPVSERLPEEKDAGILKKLGTEKKVRVCPCYSRGQGRKNDRDSLYI